jgi:hypothetical protein
MLDMLETDFETVTDGLEKLKFAINTRNQMGGALYWNICNDDCSKIARRLLSMGASLQIVHRICNGEDVDIAALNLPSTTTKEEV